MARTFKVAASAASLLLLALTASPATADETSTLTVNALTVSGGTLSVSGTASFGDDLLGPVEVWTDPEGDALVSGAGLDIVRGTIATNLASRQVIFKMSTADGAPAPVDGSPPLTGFQWPISADGQDWWRWLGAGTQGAATSTAKFTALCHNEINPGEQGGWNCNDRISGSQTQEGVTWNMPFARMKPQLDVGSTIDAGSILCGVPCSKTWPTQLVGSLAPVDTAPFPETYVIPGRIRLGIAPAGAAESSVSYTATGSLGPGATSFTGNLPAPTTPGDYTLWVKSCGGLQTSQSCVVGSGDFAIS